MKTVILSAASALLLAGGFTGVSTVHHNQGHYTPVMTLSQTEQDVTTLPEWNNLTNYVDVTKYKAKVVENNVGNRVIVLKDKNGHDQFKSIFVKRQSIQKIIDYKGGLVFNGTLTSNGKAKATVKNEKKTNVSKKATTNTTQQKVTQKAKSEKVTKKSQKQTTTTNISKFTEYQNIKKHVNVAKYQAKVVEDNANKRIIVLKDKKGHVQYKSIFVKRQGIHKIVNVKGGLVYKGTLTSKGTIKVKANTKTQVSKKATTKTTQQKVTQKAKSEKVTKKSQKQTTATNISKLPEYQNLKKHVNVAKYQVKVVEDNANKRVIVLKDKKGRAQYKSIFVKRQSIQKIINLKGGLVFNGSL
ncbi:hypothetical protein ACFFIS_06065 [Virgibacillus soli]|uniref:hypothetical protein n=1 Tax=Paracerasibacillus soli TaxID=480284 RepID=UPI0035E8D56A